MIDLARYKSLKAEVDKLQRETDRAEGALAQLMDRLLAEFGCTSLEKAKKQLKKLEQESQAAENEYNKALSDFEDQWSEVLG